MTQEDRTKMLRDISAKLKKTSAFVQAITEEVPRRENVVTIETMLDQVKADAIKLRQSFTQ